MKVAFILTRNGDGRLVPRVSNVNGGNVPRAIVWRV